ERLVTRVLVLAACLAVTPIDLAAQAVRADGPVAAVRTAIGHGDLDRARRAAAAATGADRELGLALVDLFTGRSAEARGRLTPLATAVPLGDAALELGLLALREGRRDEARRWLDPLAAVRQFAGPDDYLRLARAARGIGERLLANDAFQRIAEVPRADLKTERGDLFMVTNQPAEAATDYQAAIEIDPRWVPAHLGLALAYADGDPDAADAALDAARTLAPAHPDVWLLTAGRQLVRDEFDSVVESLDRVAAVRAGSLEEAALRAALAYGSGRRDDVEPSLAAAVAVNAHSALPFRLVGQAAARKYRFADAAAFARRGVERDVEDALALSDLGLYLLRTGDEAEARVALERSFNLNGSHRPTLNLLTMLDSLDTFTVVERGNLVFKFDPKEADILAPYAVPLAEDAYRTFVERYGFTPEGPILIEVFSKHDDFAVRTLGLPGLVGALGACFGRVITMDSPAARPPGTFSWHATLWHELAHVFTLQLSDYNVPRWLTEGVSGYEEHRRRAAWGRELNLEYAHALARDQAFGLKGLPAAFKRPESLALGYFEASLVVEHLVDEHGDAGLRRLVQAYASGVTDEEAFTRAFETTVDAADASFKAFVNERYGSLRDAMREVPRVADPDDLPGLRARVEAHPGSFVSQLAYGRALLRLGDMERAVEPLERAARLAPQATGEASPRSFLAQIAEKRGDAERARREWRALLEHDHTNVEAARRLAALATAADAEADLEFGLRLVADLDPYDADAHGRLGRLLTARGQHTEALVEFQVALAVGPANPAEAHVDLGESLLRLGRRDEARTHALAAAKVAPTWDRAQNLLLAVSGR
ncbi:MAG TPA: tetratricopeptide repeat protein, partial [Vicinamibacterales bacterium]|nr:tetratricopeptide repeat protein [Vicinamibacterales bacterium]